MSTALLSAPPVAPPALATDLAKFGDRVALVVADRSIGYRDLAAMVGSASEALTDPVHRDRRRLVLLGLDRSPEAVITYLATLASGHVALLAPDADTDALRALMGCYDPDVVARRVDGRWVVTPRRPGSAHHLHPELTVLLTTSGSTGSPKLVRLSAANVQSNADAIADALGITADDRAVTTLPLTYSYGLSVLHSHLSVGASVLLTDLSVVDAQFWDAMAHHGVTTLPGVPHTFDLLDRVGFDRQRLPHLSHVTVAGGRLAPDRVRHYAELGDRMGFDLHVMYGQTEATARIATLDPALAAVAPDAIGLPIAGGIVDLVPVPGNGDCPELGEVVYRGPNVMLGYAESRADLALGRTVDALHTGDLATRDEHGLLRIVGRTSRVAKVFGLRIDLDRVEQLLEGEGITASVTSTDGGLCVVAEGRVDAFDLADRASRASRLPLHTVHTRVVDELPRLSSGKLDRATACDRETSRASERGPRVGTPNTVHASDVVALYALLLGRPDATPDDSFVTLGGDSLSFVEVSVRLEAMLGELPDDWHLRTPRELAGRKSASRRLTAQVDTGVVLRALAIVAIVGTHVGAFELLGGAHVLLGLAGFSMARFLLDPTDGRSRPSRILRATARVAVPSVLWIGLLALVTGTYMWQNAALMGTMLGPAEWGPAWHFWFVEALVLYLLVSAALFAWPAFDRWERAHPFLVPGVLVAAGLMIRFGVVPGLADPRPSPAPALWFFWFFAIGWWAARASTTRHRAIVSAVVLVAVPGFWGATWRELAAIGGLLALVWLRSFRLPRAVVPLMTRLAAASLAIYLTHWVVFPPLERWPWLALPISLAVGVLAYACGRLAMKAAKSFSFCSAYASPYSTRARSSRSPLPM